MSVEVKIFAQLADGEMQMLGSRILSTQDRALEESAELMRAIANALDDEHFLYKVSRRNL